MEYGGIENEVYYLEQRRQNAYAGIGTFLLSPDEAESSCVSALECGYRLIDTANAYVNDVICCEV